ncbi:MAG: PAS domain S-box protein, partial [Ilumatobacteraceae bacterium]
MGAAGQALIAVDLDRVIIYWNNAAEEMYGWTAAQALGRPILELFPREETPEQVESIYDAMRRGQVSATSYEVERPDGRVVSAYGVNRPVFDRDGRLVAVIGSSVDVTEKTAEEVARRELAAIVDNSADAIFSTSTEGVVATWNPAAERLFGYAAAEIIGQPIALIADSAGIAQQAELRAGLMSGLSFMRLETTRRHKDGSVLELLVTVSTTTDAHGRPVGLSMIAQDIGERLAVERALEVSRRGLAEAQRLAHLGNFEFDLAKNELVWSDEYRRIVGVESEVTPSVALFRSLVHRDDLPMVSLAWVGATRHGRPFDLELRIVRASGEERTVRARAVAEVGEGGAVTKVSGTMTDESERVLADRIRRAAETRFEIGFEQSAIGAVIADLAGLPTRVNRAACAILGRSAEELVGTRWTAFTHPAELPLGQVVLARVGAGHDTHEDERRYVRPDGGLVWVLSNVTLIRDEHGAPQYYFSQLQDITTRKQMELDLAHQALHDSLTGLANRALLTDRLTAGLTRSRRRGARIGVIFIDIDQFKIVNDSLGHSTGDELLRDAAGRIAGAIRASDTVARFGGDEFVVVCDDIRPEDTRGVAERILHALNLPWQIGSKHLHVTASLGIAIADETSTPESLLRDSDAAMYRAKERGRSRIEVFDESLRNQAEQRLAMASALHRALERDEFVVHYQPVVDLSTGAMVSVEALLRWNHPDRGLVGPEEFIPLAEESGLIVPIGAWVLDQACQQLVEWRHVHPSLDAAKLSIAVNLSVRQLLVPDIA